MERAYTKDSSVIQGICRTSVLDIMHILGGMDRNSTHTAELLDVINNMPPEDFTECGYPSSGQLDEVYRFAEAAGDDLHVCGIEATQTEAGTHWIIGCYYPTGFYDRYVSRERPSAGRPGRMTLYRWEHDLYTTGGDGLRHDIGHWNSYALKEACKH